MVNPSARHVSRLCVSVKNPRLSENTLERISSIPSISVFCISIGHDTSAIRPFNYLTADSVPVFLKVLTDSTSVLALAANENSRWISSFVVSIRQKN